MECDFDFAAEARDWEKRRMGIKPPAIDSTNSCYDFTITDLEDIIWLVMNTKERL